MTEEGGADSPGCTAIALIICSALLVGAMLWGMQSLLLWLLTRG